MAGEVARPDKPTRIYLGCSAAFLGVFLLIGVAVALLGLSAPTQATVVPVVVGLAFAAAGGGGLLLVRWLWGQAAERERRRALAPDQPWAWKRDLSGSVVRGTSPTATVLFYGIFAGFWLGMMALITTLGWEKLRQERVAMVMMAVFWAAGIVLAALAINAVLRARRFGASTLVLDATPARLGDWLSGVIRAPLAVQGAQIELRVECVETTYSSPSSGRSSSSTWVRWRTTRLLDGARLERQADHVEIPFAVELPTNAEVTREANLGVLASVFGTTEIDLTGRDMDWYVAVSAKVPGVDYQDRFAVPVAGAAPGAATVGAAPREMPELSGTSLVDRMPARLEHQLEADVFVFPLKVSWLFWPLVLAAVAVGAPLFRRVPALAGLPDGVVFWTSLVCGVLAALSVVGLMLDTRQIEIRPGEVRIRRGVLGLGLHRTIPRQEIAAVEEKTSHSDPPSYEVNIRLRNGKRYWAIPPVSEADRAAALATRLRQILQLG